MYLSLYANARGEILEHPFLGLLGRSGNEWVVPEENEMIPLPRGAALVKIDHHHPVGLNIHEQPACIATDPLDDKQPAGAVAALLPQGFTRTLFPAGVKDKNEEGLPLLAYTAVGCKDGKMYCAAVQSDMHRKWHPVHYNTDGLPARINRMLKKHPGNRILRQLARCSLEYGCFTAQNIFYQRWEGGIPTMSACNAACIGCISEERHGVASPQQRLNYRPSVEEIAELGTIHLMNARDAIISFGQGCEGEPSLNARDLSMAIRQVREKTSEGTININTNAGYTRGIKLMVEAGLDAMRVTMFSCLPHNYELYHCPQDYNLDDVKKSIDYAKSQGVKVSLNLLIFPGFHDREPELEALLSFVQNHGVDMIQMRNLNIDPELLMKTFPGGGPGIGIVNFLALLQEKVPAVEIASYTHPVQ
ncbi:MAG: radical SAM protein [Syntrophomonas sp.]